VAIALTMLGGFWLDAHRALGSQGVIAFLVLAVGVFLGVELVAGAAGEMIEQRRMRRG
jgi:hypothetical protein